MPAYPGRFDYQIRSSNLGGLNLRASAITGEVQQAQWMNNVDIDLSGSIRRRNGFEVRSTFNNPDYLTAYVVGGVLTFVVVADSKVFTSTSTTGPWADVTGGMTISRTRAWTSASVGGELYLANGQDNPLVLDDQGLRTLEVASMLPPPSGVQATGGTKPSSYYQFSLFVVAVTDRGETIMSAPALLFSADQYPHGTLTWTPVVGATGYLIYAQADYFVSGAWQWNLPGGRLAQVAGETASSYTFAGTEQIDPKTPFPASNTAFNTPNVWNQFGQPEGVFAISKGKEQRLGMWRGSEVWLSSAGDPTNWFRLNDAFYFQLYGPDDPRIKAVATLFDYTVLFTPTDAAYFTGSGGSDFSLSRIQPVGCVSPRSIVAVGDDIYLWSWKYGPTSVKRILQGADVASQRLADPVAPMVQTDTERSAWPGIVAWDDPKHQRACWAYPPVGFTANSEVLVLQYSVNGWTHYDGWPLVAVTKDANQDVLGLLEDGRLVVLNQGNTDGGTAIAWEYIPCQDNFRSHTNKQAPFVDVVMDSSNAYDLQVSFSWDFDSNGVSGPFRLTESETDGNPTIRESKSVNLHRCYIHGMGRWFGLKFQGSSTGPSPVILGWRADVRGRGIR